MAQRIKWIDVCRCFGIFAVYLGHFGENAGRVYPFLYTHHVPLFFFLSGCMAPRDALPLRVHAKKTVDGLLVPWLFFALASALFSTVYTDSGLTGFLALLKQIAQGTIVDHFVAGGLWFFVCLAGIRLLFALLQKLRHPAAILAACLTLHLIEGACPIPNYYNLHRCFRFIIYYAAGYCAFPYLSRALAPETQRGRMLLTFSGLFSLGFSALVYFGRDPLAFLSAVPLGASLAPILTALIIIWLYLLVSKLSEHVLIFNEIGKKTLFLCGSEYFAVQLLKSVVRLFGLELAYPRPVCAWICVAILLYLAYRFLVPMEERLLKALRRFPGWLNQRSPHLHN